jgi:hypothetical protein
VSTNAFSARSARYYVRYYARYYVVVRNPFAELYVLFAVATSTRKLTGQAVQI